MDATMLVAITGFIVGIGGLLLNVRGVRDQNRQQSAATQAMGAKGRLDETQQALDAVEKRAELAETGETRKQARIDQLEDELDEERLLRRHQLAQQEARCREQVTALTDALITLRGVVVDEVARAAALTALDRNLPHPHERPEIEP